MLNLSENGNYNPNFVWINKIPKRYLIVWIPKLCFLNWHSETFPPFGIIGQYFRAPLNPLCTILPRSSKSLREILNLAPTMLDASLYQTASCQVPVECRTSKWNGFEWRQVKANLLNNWKLLQYKIQIQNIYSEISSLQYIRHNIYSTIKSQNIHRFLKPLYSYKIVFWVISNTTNIYYNHDFFFVILNAPFTILS